MAPQAVWSCRGTIRSHEKPQCPIEDIGGKACWEVVREVDAFSFNVCCDCLVFVAGQKDSILSRREIQDIMAYKGLDALSGNHCQQFANAVGK